MAHLTVPVEFAPIASSNSRGTAFWTSDAPPSQPAVAFGNLVDLARFRFETASAEICEVCNTINFGRLHYCKCCSHKMPAFYAACEAEEEPKLPRQRMALAAGASLTDFAAFVVIVNLLVGIAQFASVW